VKTYITDDLSQKTTSHPEVQSTETKYK